MAVLQNTENTSLIAAVYSLAAARIREVSDRYKAWNKHNQARAELLRYTDRELADIGLNRTQVLTMDFSQDG
jgi:uncharacterized protein YjiS (DUF1127 family)